LKRARFFGEAKSNEVWTLEQVGLPIEFKAAAPPVFSFTPGFSLGWRAASDVSNPQ